jgi:thymidine kinase
MEVICGGMFSGKSEELIRRLRRVQIAGKRVEIFKPAIDNRYAEEQIVSHNDSRVPCTPVVSSGNILLLASGVDVVGIDEAQFFDDGITEVLEKLMMNGTRVIVAGLDMDYTGKPFGPIPALLARAEYITKLHAICMQCGDLASFSYRKNLSPELVLVGEKESYEPRCRKCFYS